MIRLWPMWPVLASVSLAVSAYWWNAKKETWQPPPARKPDLPKVEAMPQLLPLGIKRAQDRPLLWTSRRPVDVEDKKGSQTSELMQSRLTAVLESGSQRVAILQRPDGTTLKISTETNPWRIESFDGRKAIFVSATGGERVERPLEAGPPAVVKTGAPNLSRVR